jgi:hypothetical protein
MTVPPLVLVLPELDELLVLPLALMLETLPPKAACRWAMTSASVDEALASSSKSSSSSINTPV